MSKGGGIDLYEEFQKRWPQDGSLRGIVRYPTREDLICAIRIVEPLWLGNHENSELREIEDRIAFDLADSYAMGHQDGYLECRDKEVSTLRTAMGNLIERVRNTLIALGAGIIPERSSLEKLQRRVEEAESTYDG